MEKITYINENHSTETHGDEMSGKTADEILAETKEEEKVEDDDNIVSQIETTENSEDIDNIDDLYSVTSEIPNVQFTSDEVSIDSYRKDTTNNPNGFNTISNMNDYLNKFDDADKPMIAQMLASNEIKFICQ